METSNIKEFYNGAIKETRNTLSNLGNTAFDIQFKNVLNNDIKKFESCIEKIENGTFLDEQIFMICFYKGNKLVGYSPLQEYKEAYDTFRNWNQLNNGLLIDKIQIIVSGAMCSKYSEFIINERTF